MSPSSFAGKPPTRESGTNAPFHLQLSPPVSQKKKLWGSLGLGNPSQPRGKDNALKEESQPTESLNGIQMSLDQVVSDEMGPHFSPELGGKKPVGHPETPSIRECFFGAKDVVIPPPAGIQSPFCRFRRDVPSLSGNRELGFIGGMR